MKRIILFIFLILNVLSLSESINVQVPKNYTDMFLYKDLELGKYQGVYVDIFSNIQEDTEFSKELNYQLSDENKNDILLRAIETEEGGKNYNYINTPLIYRVAIVVKKDSDIKNIGNVDKLKVAYIASQQGMQEIEERYKNITFDKIAVSTVDEGLQYLKNNEVDAFIVKNWNEKNSGESNFKALENMKYTEKIGIKKNSLEVQKVIGEYINSLSSEELQNIIDLNRVKFYKYLLKDTPSYEKVRDNYKEIRVKLGKDKFILPFYYEKNGEYKGLTINIVKELEDIIGVPFKFVKDGDYDINGIAIESKEGQKKFFYTKPYYEMKLSVANRTSGGFVDTVSDLDGSKVIVLEGDYIQTYLKNILKDSTFIVVPTYEDGLKALLNKKGDYLVGYFGILTGAITNNFLDDKVKVAGILNEKFGVSLAIEKDKDALINVVDIISESFTVDKTIMDTDLLKNSIVTQNYKLILKVAIPTFIFIIVLVVAIIISEKNRKKAEELSFALVEVLEMANQLNDEDTGDHVKRLGLYSTLLSEKANLPSEMRKEIKRFSSLHDLGKVAIPSEILKKPSKLTKEEFDKVKEHVEIGYGLVKKLKLGKVAENIVRYHHEKWNGSGYPLGLKEEDIPLEARIVSIVDVYDALRQDKFHRKGLTHEEAIEVISKGKGVEFDPRLVDIFIENNKEFEKIYEENKESLHLVTEFYSAIKNK